MSTKCLLIACVQPALSAKKKIEERRLSNTVVNRVPHPVWCSWNVWREWDGSTQATCRLCSCFAMMLRGGQFRVQVPPVAELFQTESHSSLQYDCVLLLVERNNLRGLKRLKVLSLIINTVSKISKSIFNIDLVTLKPISVST